MKFEPRYLGDGLYATFDGYQIELYASDGTGKINSVYLDPHTLAYFENYIQDLKRQIEKSSEDNSGEK